MSSSQKIPRLSRVLKYVFVFSACALPLLNAGFWITDGYPFLKPWLEWNLLPQMGNSLPTSIAELTAHIKFFAFLVSLIPTIFNMTAFLLLARLFQTFEQLEIFSLKTVQYAKKLGMCILCAQLIYPVYYALITLVLTISNPPGTRILATALGLEQITMGIVGAVIILVSWIFEKGHELQEEHARVI